MSVTLYTAISIDGYIAREDGSIDWLEEAEPDGGQDYGYDEFFQNVDLLLMGRNTYEQVLSFGQWPYEDKRCIVFTSRDLSKPQEDVVFVNDSPSTVIARLQGADEANAWLVGGGRLNASFLEAGLIDEIILTILPICLGTGIGLFRGGASVAAGFSLVSATTFGSGAIQARYIRRG
jgi:dihydrofolate reductase